MIGVAEARAKLLQAAVPTDVVEVALADALGRVLARPIVADRDLPPTDRSAMDGYAVRAADLAGAPCSLRRTGEVRAGQPVGDVRVEARGAVRIYTGAIVPPGADAVVMVEQTEETGDGREVRFREPVRAGQHIRRCGEDVLRGATVLRPGTAIHAAEVAALATVGATRVPVHRPPAVSVLSTGDEIVEAGRTPAAHQVRNSNACALVAQLRELGLAARDLGNAPDDPAGHAAALRRGLEGDLLLVTGGVSVGRYDLVAQTLAELGMELLFHKVAMKPGKPVLAGRRGGTLVVGLPGNPVSAFTGFVVLVAPALWKLAGLAHGTTQAEVRAELAEPLFAKPGRTTYHLGRVAWSGDRWRARPVPNVSSGDVLSLARANAFLITPADGGPLGSGEAVAAILWRDFWARAPEDPA